ncbi:MAG: hypothetical protein IJS67_01820, partial [Clostridia bacterium]|nr:hypothetical protein [Clostridia bacterium]
MSERKNNSVLNFFRRNLYYLIIGLALIVTAVVIAAVLLSERNDPVAQNGGGERVIESDTASQNETVSSQKTDKPVDKEEESIEEKQSEKEDEKTDTTAKIVFTMPVATADVSKEFTSSTVVYNSTLGVYTGHMGIDFSASEGTDVVAAYGGKIESVTT